MQDRRARRHCIQGAREPPELLDDCLVITIGRMKMSRGAGWRSCPEHLPQRPHLIPLHAAPAHPGVDREVPIRVAGCRRPRRDHRARAEQRRQPRVARARNVRFENRREHHDRALDAGGPRSSAPSSTVATPYPHGLERLERERDCTAPRPYPSALTMAGTEPRRERPSRRRCARRAQVDLDPGAHLIHRRGAVRTGRVIYGTSGMPMQRKSALDDTLALMRDLRRAATGMPRRPTSRCAPISSRKRTRSTTRSAAATTRLLREELGDLLLQVLFHSVLAEERGAFDADDVADALVTKMRARHPHLYGDGVKEPWERMKAKKRRSIVDGLPAVPGAAPRSPAAGTRRRRGLRLARRDGPARESGGGAGGGHRAAAAHRRALHRAEPPPGCGARTARGRAG